MREYSFGLWAYSSSRQVYRFARPGVKVYSFSVLSCSKMVAGLVLSRYAVVKQEQSQSKLCSGEAVKLRDAGLRIADSREHRNEVVRCLRVAEEQCQLEAASLTFATWLVIPREAHQVVAVDCSHLSRLSWNSSVGKHCLEILYRRVIARMQGLLLAHGYCTARMQCTIVRAVPHTYH